MTDYFEIAQRDTGDARMIARSVAPPGLYIFERFHDPHPIADAPDLVWSWDAPAPLRDWCPAIGRARVFSPRMAELVRAHLGPRDRVEWLAATVLTPDGLAHPYEVPHFLHYPDMYDDGATEWGPSGLPIRWVLSRPKLAGLHFFARPRAAGPVIVDEALLTAMQDAGLTGLDIRTVRITG